MAKLTKDDFVPDESLSLDKELSRTILRLQQASYLLEKAQTYNRNGQPVTAKRFIDKAYDALIKVQEVLHV